MLVQGLESFIAELEVFAGQLGDTEGKSLYTVLGAILNECEESKASLHVKFLLAKFILTGMTYDKGSQPYQDFATLIALRNAIVHHKPEKVQEEPGKVLKRLRDMGLASPAVVNLRSSWLANISTRAVARWACNVCGRIIEPLRSGQRMNDATSVFFSFFLSNRFDVIEAVASDTQVTSPAAETPPSSP